MRYSYMAKDGGGAVLEGFVEAGSEQQAVRRLAADGLRVVELKSLDKKAKTAKASDIRAAGLEQPLGELAILLGGGVTAYDACESVARTAASPAAARCFTNLAERLRIGEGFADAFAAAAPEAPAAVKAIIKAGDASGALGPAVKEAAETLSFQGALTRDLVSALIYPAILFLSGLGAAFFMTTMVIPQFASSLGARVNQLPPFTQSVFAASIWLKANLPSVTIATGAIAALLGQALRSPAWRGALVDSMLSVPVLRGFLLSFESARWSGLFAAMISRRTPLLEAFAIARDGFISGRLTRQMLQAERAVRRGEAIAAALAAHTSLPPTLINLIAAGEASGDLAGAARSAAAVFQERARTTGKRVAALAEPLAVLLIGGFIGTLAVTLLTAISGATTSGV